MFIVKAEKVISSVTQTEKMTSGSKNVYVVKFEFSEEWQYLERTAVFRSGQKIINILLDEENKCMVPWEVMTTKGVGVDVGVFGTRDGEVVMPTTWSSMGTMLEGVVTGVEPSEPTPDVYQQLLSRLKRIEDSIGVEGGPITPGPGTETPGGVNFSVGDGLSLDDNDVLSVKTPVNRIVTQAEFDLLSEAEQTTGLWIIK